MSDPTVAAVAAGTTVAVVTSAGRAAGSLLSPLLKPVFTTVGKELDARVKSWLAERKEEKRIENVKAHVEVAEKVLSKRRVKSKKGKDNPEANRTVTSQSLRTVESWYEEAKDIDPDDVRAPAWQSILIDLMDEKNVDEFLIETLRSMKARDMTALIAVGKFRPLFLPRHSDDRSFKNDGISLKRLLERNLVRMKPDVFWIGLVVLAAQPLWRWIQFARTSTPSLHELMIALSAPDLWINFVMFFFYSMFLVLRTLSTGSLFSYPILTWLGKDIIYRANEVRQSIHVQETPAPASTSPTEL